MNQLKKSIEKAMANPTLTPEQRTDAIFARLEIVELLAGIRTLDRCPGLEAMAKHIETRKHAAKQT